MLQWHEALCNNPELTFRPGKTAHGLPHPAHLLAPIDGQTRPREAEVITWTSLPCVWQQHTTHT